jgi:hypothetical protein
MFFSPLKSGDTANMSLSGHDLKTGENRPSKGHCDTIIREACLGMGVRSTLDSFYITMRFMGSLHPFTALLVYPFCNILINQAVIALPEEMNQSILRFKQRFWPIQRYQHPSMTKDHIGHLKIPRNFSAIQNHQIR